jgi:putative GTP pyrophosphokinase
VLERYDQDLAALQAAALQLEVALAELLANNGLAVQSVTARVKARESLRQKLARPDRTYHQLFDVTDLVGLRVVAYFEDDVDVVARLIEGHFSVDFTRSTDKQRFRDAQRFGYRSLHYVCALPNGALDPAFRFEIQVRTALQHAWAEIEHDLGYKAESVPPALRRRFSRVASLLEIADQEFIALRRELSRYQAAVSDAPKGEVAELSVDVLSLDGLTRAPAVRALDDAVIRALGRPGSDELFFPPYLVGVLHKAGLRNGEQLLMAAARFGGELESFVPRYFQFSAECLDFPAERVELVQRGYGLLFLGLLTILRSEGLILGKLAALTALYAELDRLEEKEAHRLANALLAKVER